MKRKLMSILTGMLIITTSSTMPPVQAQVESLTHFFPALEGVQLAPEQRVQLEKLRDEMLPQIQGILTPDQQTQFGKALEQGKGLRKAFGSVHPSVQQLARMGKISQAARSQLVNILTPQQQQQIQQNARSLK